MDTQRELKQRPGDLLVPKGWGKACSTSQTLCTLQWAQSAGVSDAAE